MAQPGLQGLLFGLLEWRGNLGHMVGKSVLYCTDYANQGSEGIQHRHPYYPNVGQFLPPALPLHSIAARNFHQHLNNLNHPNVGRLVPWILPTFGSPENLVLTSTLTNPNPEMVPDPHGKCTLPSSHLLLYPSEEAIEVPILVYRKAWML